MKFKMTSVRWKMNVYNILYHVSDIQTSINGK